MKLIPLINKKKCILCGRCVEVCPKKIILIKDKDITISADECMLCAHCYDVCSKDAVSFEENVLAGPLFKNFKYIEKKSVISPADLVNFFRSRRSVRKFTDRPVSDSIIDDLIEFGVTAPSGSNCQLWEFSIVNGSNRVWNLALDIKNFFIRLNGLAENPLIRSVTAPFTRNALGRYYHDHIESVKWAIEESERGIDLLFHSAPCVIIIHDSGEGSTPAEDAQFAGYNISLLAHSLGLGTCFIGYAVEALNRMTRMKEKYNIPQKNRVRCVIALGYPDVKFLKYSLRKNYIKRKCDL